MPFSKLKVSPIQEKIDMVVDNPKPLVKDDYEDRSEMLFSYMNMIAFNNKVDLKLN